MEITIITENWTEIGEIGNGGDVGGDIQVSDSFNRRFACRPEGSAEFHVLDFYTYWAQEDPDTMRNAREKPWVQTQVGYSVCTDLGDVGGTEVSGDYRYWDNVDVDLAEADVNDLTLPRTVCQNLTREDLNEATNQMGA